MKTVTNVWYDWLKQIAFWSFIFHPDMTIVQGSRIVRSFHSRFHPLMFCLAFEPVLVLEADLFPLYANRLFF